MRKKFSFVTLFVMAALLLSACAGTAAAQSLTQTTDQNQNQVNRTINVNGAGKVFLTPDIAHVTIGVHTESKDAAQAVAQNNTQATAVKDALNKMGIEDKDIQTTNFSIYPQQQYDQNGRPTGDITYIVDNQLYVTVRDISKIGDLLDTVINAGANNIYGIQFDVADRTKATSDARKLAVQDAQTQAEELAQAAGVTLGPVQTISVSGGQMPVPLYEKGVGGGAAMAAAPSVPVSSGQMVLEVDVNMVYGIQ
jgi:uncharacterized protein YggE